MPLELLSEERQKLETLAEELLEKEIVTDREIYELLDFPIPESLQEKGISEGDQREETPSRPSAEEKPKQAGDSIDPGLLGLEGA